MNFKTGDVGENLVQLWASQAKITANPVRRDEFGWDFCLQIRRDGLPEKVVPLDQLPPELTAMVQVKTTLAGTTAADISLANWQRMVKDPFPWFVVRIVLNADGEPEHVFVVHVDETWIARVLRRLREFSAEGATDLSSHTISVTWAESDALSHPIGPALRRRIVETVGNLDDYVRQKLHVRQTVGYGERPYVVRFTSPVPKDADGIEREVDFAIGLVKSLPISALTVSEMRFEVPAVLDDKQDFEGTVEFSARPSSGTTRLHFSNTARTDSLALDFETYLPTFLFPNLPKEHFKARFVSSVAEVVVVPSRELMHVSWKLPDGDVPSPLSHVACAGRLIGLFARAGETGGVTISYENAKTGLVDLARGGMGTFSAAVVRVSALLQHAEFLARYFGLDTKLLVRLDHIDDQEEQLTTLRGILDRAAGAYTIKVQVPGAAPDDKRWAIVLPMSARVGDSVLAASVAVIGAPVWEADDWLSINQGEVRVLTKSVVPVADWKTFDHIAKTRKLCSELGDDLTIVGCPAAT